MNLPNKLTLARILAIPLFVGLLYLGQHEAKMGNQWTPGLIFLGTFCLTVVVAITDWLDGYIARKQNIVTNFGKLADPLADKVYVAAALICLTDLGMIPAWAVVIIIAREFIVTGLRQLAQDAGSVVPADRLGKHKTGWQLALILVCLLVMGVNALEPGGSTELPAAVNFHPEGWENYLILLPLSVTLFLTILSGWNYLWRQRELFRGSL